VRPILWALWVSLCAASANGQEFSLDLSEEKAPDVPLEFRPTLAVLSVKGSDGDEVSSSRARKVEAELLKQLAQGNQFGTVLGPSQVRELLGAEMPNADACADYGCLETLAKKLNVHRLMKLSVQKQGAGSLVTMLGWDPGFNEVLTQTQDSGEKPEKVFVGMTGKSQATKDKEFMKKMGAFLGQIQKALATANGKIVVNNAEHSATVLLDGAPIGTGSVEAIVQRGTHSIKINEAGYLPFQRNVGIEPMQSVDVTVSLIAKPLEITQLTAAPSPAPSILSKPGLYVAIVGAIAAGVGVALGQTAQDVKMRLEAGGSPVSVTRTEAKAAPTQALLSNVLVGAGAAAVAGGVAWVIVTLPPPPQVTKKAIAGEPMESTIPAPGAMLHFGGRF
jgi:hypothetical protein